MSIPPPKPLLRTQREVDALYDTLSLVSTHLSALGIPYLLIAGSLLGAARSRSFLFCDDDADIAVFENDYPKVLEHLPALLNKQGHYTKRPFPAADRVRPSHCTQVWVDVFVLRRYDSLEDLQAVLSHRVNGTPNPNSASTLAAIAANGDATFPIWHYDNRLALELWPREYFTGAELFPLAPIPFGHLSLPAPAHPITHLLRAYGPKCFEEWLLATQHAAHHKETAAKLAAMGGVGGSAGSAVGGVADADTRFPLEDRHFAPITHSKHRTHRSRSSSGHPSTASLPSLPQWSRAHLEALLAAESQWDGSPGTHPTLWPPSTATSGLTLLGQPQQHHPPLLQHLALQPQRLGEALKEATGGASGPLVFSPALLSVLEPHVAKARDARKSAREESVRAGVPYTPPPGTLSQEFPEGRYDPHIFPLAETLARALLEGEEGAGAGAGAGAAAEVPDGPCVSSHSLLLSRLHHILGPGGKHGATGRLKDPAIRLPFTLAFHDFIKKVALPNAMEAAATAAAAAAAAAAALAVAAIPEGSSTTPPLSPPPLQPPPTALVQCFPCLRIILPGEFSLGVHCDTFYHHAPANVNYVVPLTAGARLHPSASLHVESAPGKEDWHALGEGGEGTFARFHGGQCLHWTGENCSAGTRVSLDFRVLWGAGGGDGTPVIARGDKYQREEGYYCKWVYKEGEWEREGPLWDPDERVGYPFGGVRRQHKR